MGKINFFAPINQDSFNGFMNGISQTADPITIDFASEGGDVNAGFRMYHYLRSLGRPIIINNIGDVCSIAVVVYLAADVRAGSPNCIFGIHRLACELKGSTSLLTLREREHSLLLDIDRYNRVFQERTVHATQPISILDTLRGASELLLDADAAASCGIINDPRPNA